MQIKKRKKGKEKKEAKKRKGKKEKKPPNTFKNLGERIKTKGIFGLQG